MVSLAAVFIFEAAAAAAPPPTFAVCLACHTITQGAPSRSGPNLYGVIGRAAGTYPGFSYSAAMKSSGITWTADELERFLTSPQVRVAGTAMSFPGLDDPATRKEIIDYLQTAR
jgi:cytochrome c